MYKVFVVLTVLVVLAAGRSGDLYTTKYDGVNLNNILNNDRLLDGYVKCLLDKGPCAQDAAELKKDVPEALENNCGKCNPRQREGVTKVLRFLFEKKPDIFSKLEAKYDSKGLYRNRYRDQAAKEGIKV